MSVELSDDLAANYRGVVADRGISFEQLAAEMSKVNLPGHHVIAQWARQEHDVEARRAAHAAVAAQVTAEQRASVAAAERAALVPERTAAPKSNSRGRRTADPRSVEQRD